MTVLLWSAAVAALLLVTLWAIQLRTQDAATADLGWSMVIAGGAIVAAITLHDDIGRRLLVGGMAAVWALRLACYLLVDRILPHKGEDGRYHAMRNHWGERAPRFFLLVYLGQGLVAALFIVPIVAAMRGGPIDAWAVAGAIVWFIAVLGETIADRQLAAFRADPANRGTVCRKGLWQYSRHPNYFFEWLHWWAYVLIAHGALLTLLGPAAMLLFLFRITGIPWTELQAEKSRGEKYREYQRTTSIFIPWPPRRDTT